MRALIAMLILGFVAAPSHAGWKKTVTKGGKTTVTGDAETMARHEREKEARAAYDKEIAAAPRRAASDPIRVTLLNPVWNGKNKNDNHNRANKMLLDEFKNDPVLRVTMADIPRRTGKDQADVDTLVAEAKNRKKAGEVYIVTTLGTEAALGRTKDGKAAVGNAIVYKADVYSAYEAGSRNVKELGNILQTTQMVKNVAKRVGEIVRNDIGPRLPSAEAVAEINKKHMRSALAAETGIEPGDDAKTIMKKLFAPKKRAN